MSIPRFSTDRDDHDRRSRNGHRNLVVAAGLLCLLLVAPHAAHAQCPCVTQASGFAGGDGSPGDPYQVCSPAHLDNVRNHLSSHFIQIADIDMGGFGNFTPIGKLQAPFVFDGTYDGAGFVVDSLTINEVSSQAGLFNKLSSTAAVKNLMFSSALVDGISIIGVAAAISEGIIENVQVEGTITGGSTVGMLVGELSGGSVSSCSSIGTMSLTGSLCGGLVGNAGVSSLISDSYSQVAISSSGVGDGIGGLLGVIGNSRAL